MPKVVSSVFLTLIIFMSSTLAADQSEIAIFEQIEDLLLSKTIFDACDGLQMLIEEAVKADVCVHDFFCDELLTSDVDKLCNFAAACPDVHLPTTPCANAKGECTAHDTCSERNAYKCLELVRNTVLPEQCSSEDDLSKVFLAAQNVASDVLLNPDSVKDYCSDDYRGCKNAVSTVLSTILEDHKELRISNPDDCSFMFYLFDPTFDRATDTDGSYSPFDPDPEDDGTVTWLPFEEVTHLLGSPLCQTRPQNPDSYCLNDVIELMTSSEITTCATVSELGCCPGVVGNCFKRLLELDPYQNCQFSQECIGIDGLGDIFPEQASCGVPLDCEPLCQTCGEHEHVSFGRCVRCPPGTRNTAGDQLWGGDTTCDPIVCDVNEHVKDHVCVPCEDGFHNGPGDFAEFEDTYCRPCSLSAPIGSFYTEFCFSYDDAVFQECSTPKKGEYVEIPCFPGSPTEKGRDTVISTCSEPEDGEYVHETCVAGSSSTKGKNTDIKQCVSVTQGTFVVDLCVRGDAFNKGSSGAVQNCAQLERVKEQFFSEACTPGHILTTKGKNSAIQNCKTASATQYYISNCVHGSLDEAGKDSDVGECKQTSGSQFYKSTCKTGFISERSSDGASPEGQNSDVGDCKIAQSGELYFEACVEGTLKGSPGHDSTLKTCASFKDTETTHFYSRACSQGTLREAGGVDSIVSECTAPAIDEFAEEACVPGSVSTGGADTKNTKCSKPSSSEFVEEFCVAGDRMTGGGKDTKITGCETKTPNDGDYYINSCVNGDFNGPIGSNSKIVACSKPVEFVNFISKSCVKGDFTKAGTDTDFTPCKSPSSGFFVFEVCSLSGDTVTQSCTSSIPSDSFVSKLCLAGSPSARGSQPQFQTCKVPGAGEEVTKACDKGSLTPGSERTGSDTIVDPIICKSNFRVLNNECVKCTDNTINLGGEPASGPNTSCVDPADTKSVIKMIMTFAGLSATKEARAEASTIVKLLRDSLKDPLCNALKSGRPKEDEDEEFTCSVSVQAIFPGLDDFKAVPDIQFDTALLSGLQVNSVAELNALFTAFEAANPGTFQSITAAFKAALLASGVEALSNLASTMSDSAPGVEVLDVSDSPTGDGATGGASFFDFTAVLMIGVLSWFLAL